MRKHLLNYKIDKRELRRFKRKGKTGDWFYSLDKKQRKGLVAPRKRGKLNEWLKKVPDGKLPF